MEKSLSLLLAILLFAFAMYGQDSLWQRTYEFGAFNNYDLRNSSVNAIGTYRAINDGFESLISSKMKPKGEKITKSIFNFATVYLTMLWSHEIGHAIRARQVEGKFNIHNFGLPVPYTTADLPSDISLQDEALFVTAGFEVNYLNVRSIQSEFIQYNGLWNEDLAFAFANRLMYPIYTTFVVPIDPEDPSVWIKTAGDPVHYILPVFKNYSDDQVFLDENTVNPALVKLYNQATILAQVINLLDPQFYREVGAAFGKSSKIRTPIFLIGDYFNGWTYGTLFNASPLGYELYWQNYLHLKNKQFGLYFKYGRPFKNLGMGVSMNKLIYTNKLSTDILLEVWDQEIFGNGFSIDLDNQWKIKNDIGINFNVGYKTKGYILGKQLSRGLNLGVGVCIYNLNKLSSSNPMN